MESLFFEIFNSLPRQGPGTTEATQKAFRTILKLQSIHRILDIGCGTGAQTLDLGRITDARILALDNHFQFIKNLQNHARNMGPSEKIKGVVGDMFSLSFINQKFNLIWSEGAIYIIGFNRGLKEWRDLLRPFGYMAVTEVIWIKKILRRR